MYASDYFENGVLNTLKGITFTAPADVYLTLCISDPTDTGLSGGNFKRTLSRLARRARARADSAVSKITLLTSGKPRGIVVTACLENSVNLYFDKPKAVSFSSIVDMTFDLNKLINNTTLFGADVKNSVTLSKKTRRSLLLESGVKCAVDIAKLMHHQHYFSSIVNAFISVIHTETETTTIDVTIPPGGELRIDSDNFIVLLDGVNIIHLHSGDWVTIDRNLLEFTVDTGSGGNLQGQVLFSERYL